jgi:hypothetical protein
MSKVTDYFSWQDGPAVVAENINDPSISRGYYIAFDGKEWSTANGAQVFDFFKDGEPMKKATFEERFGSIGQDLPSLPAT